MIYTARIFDRFVLLPLLCLFSLGAVVFLVGCQWRWLAAAGVGSLYLAIIRRRLLPKQSFSGLTAADVPDEETSGSETVMLELGLKLLEQRILVSQACNRVAIIVGIASGLILHSALGWQWYSAAILGLVCLVFSGAFLKLLFRAI